MAAEEKDNNALLGKIAKTYSQFLLTLFALLLVVVALLLFPNAEKPEELILVEEDDRVENGIHVATGFIDDAGLDVVKVQCTACHSADLVTQNRASRDGWEEMIRWMQETQNLWDLGANEPIILDYLARNYAPKETGRRKPLENIDWYELEN